jgi:hypothetical protein
MKPHPIRCPRLSVESLDERALPAVPVGLPLDPIVSQQSLHHLQRGPRELLPFDAVDVRAEHWFSAKPEVRDGIRDPRETSIDSDEGLEHRRNLLSAPAADQLRPTETELRPKGEDAALRRNVHPTNEPDESELAAAAVHADAKSVSPIPILTQLIWVQPFEADDSDHLPSERQTDEPPAPMTFGGQIPAPKSDPEVVTLVIPLPIAGSLPLESGALTEAVDQFLDHLGNIGREFRSRDDFIEIAAWSAAGLLAGGAVGSMVNDLRGSHRAGPWPRCRINPETISDRSRRDGHSRARD